MQAGAEFGRRRFDRAQGQTAAAPSPKPLTFEALAVARPDVAGGPYATIGLLVLLILVFMGQEHFTLGSGLSYAFSERSMLALGGSGRAWVDAGDWWRVFTAPMLHANLGHLIGNGVALVLAGLLLERLIGWAWFLATYVAGGLGGELMSLQLQDPHAVGMGASGAIMGLLAATLVCSLHAGAKGRRGRMRLLALRVMIPALLPLAGDSASHGLQISYSAHFGGALAGAAMGVLINTVWLNDDEKPILRPVAAAMGLAGLLAATASFGVVATHYPAYQAVNATLAPDGLLPTDDEPGAQAVAGLAARFPNDPRVHLMQALAEERDGRYGAADDELRTALTERSQLALLGPELEPIIRLVLVGTLLSERRLDDAKSEAAPICGHHFLQQNLNDYLAKAPVCPAA